jgi:hypothetical protein
MVGVTLGLIALICLPGIVATLRAHPYAVHISIVCGLLWWTIVAWIICMAVAMSDVGVPDESEDEC